MSAGRAGCPGGEPRPPGLGEGGGHILLYDYTFRAPGTRTKSESAQKAYDSGVRFEEVSPGHPREWNRYGAVPAPMRRILGAGA